MDGEHYWEIEFIEPPMGTSVMVGVGTKETLLHTENYQYVDLIGESEVLLCLFLWPDNLLKSYKTTHLCIPFNLADFLIEDEIAKYMFQKYIICGCFQDLLIWIIKITWKPTIKWQRKNFFSKTQIINYNGCQTVNRQWLYPHGYHTNIDCQYINVGSTSVLNCQYRS